MIFNIYCSSFFTCPNLVSKYLITNVNNNKIFVKDTFHVGAKLNYQTVLQQLFSEFQKIVQETITDKEQIKNGVFIEYCICTGFSVWQKEIPFTKMLSCKCFFHNSLKNISYVLLKIRMLIANSILS